MRYFTLVAGLAFASLATAARVVGQEVAYSGSVQFATGDYFFTERTNSFLFSNGVAVNWSWLSLSASIPLILQSSPWISYSGGGLVPSGGAQSAEVGRQMGRHVTDQAELSLPDTTRHERFGIGDPFANVGVQVLSEGSLLPSLRVIGHLKVPIAEVDRGFGTGEWDYGAGVSLTKRVAGALVFADLSYWQLGDLPDLELKDAIAYNIALGRFLNARYALLVSLSGYSEIVAGSEPPAQLGLGLSYLLERGKSLLASVALGLSESTPDISLSFGWRTPL